MASLSKVTKIIVRPCQDITVKHVVNFGSKDQKTGKSRGIGNVYDYTVGGENRTSLTLDTYDSIVIESNILKNKDNRNVMANFSYGELDQLTRALQATRNWLERDTHRVFTTDGEGKVNGIANSKDFTNVVQILYSFENQATAVAFSPTIIEDVDRVRYKGVAIRTPDGVLGSLTEWEFHRLYWAIYYLCGQLYHSSLTLAGVGMTYFMKGGQNNGGKTMV